MAANTAGIQGSTTTRERWQGAQEAKQCVCRGCGEVFSSRGALFRHLRSGGPCGVQAGLEGTQAQARVVRCCMLFGFWARAFDSPGARFQTEAQLASGCEDRLQPAPCGTVEHALWSALRLALGDVGADIGAATGAGTDAGVEITADIGADVEAAPRAATRASRCDKGAHAACNVLAFSCAVTASRAGAVSGAAGSEMPIVAPPNLTDGNDDACAADAALAVRLTAALRARLRRSAGARSNGTRTRVSADNDNDGDICIHGIIAVPRLHPLHARRHCERKRYEYLLPLWMLVPGATAQDGLRSALCSRAHGEQVRRSRGTDWNEEDKRVHDALARLKRLLKCMRGTHTFHNFSPNAYSGTVGESKRQRTISRCRVAGIRVAEVDCAVVSVEANKFLWGQVQRMIGLILAVMCAGGVASSATDASDADTTDKCSCDTGEDEDEDVGLNRLPSLPDRIVSAAVRPDVVLRLPAAPASCMYLREAVYDRYEVSSGGVRIRPRPPIRQQRDEGARGGHRHGFCSESSARSTETWVHELRRRIVVEQRWAPPAEVAQTGAEPDTHADLLVPWARRVLPAYIARLAHAAAPEPGAEVGPESEAGGGVAVRRGELCNRQLLAVAPLPAPPHAYIEVLRILRGIDQGGLWPASTAARSALITGAEKTPTPAGSFTIGATARGMPPPRANTTLRDTGLWPALVALEKAIAPAGRKPSSTVAVNRHARFAPHRDRGAGAGQSQSLIVGLGDYHGGELGVVPREAQEEGEGAGVAYGIRYAPLEFDGWAQLHWTRPFKGERYTLVWFTPLGVEDDC